MKIAIVDYEKHDLSNLRKIIEDNFLEEFGIDRPEIELFGNNTSDRPYLFQKLKAYGPDIMITFNLAGFEIETLTDSVSFNLLDCIQLHWVGKKDTQNEKYLNKVLSIVMFFATNDGDLAEYLKQTYDKIPMLSSYEESDTDNAVTRALIDVIKETGIIKMEK